MGTPVSVLGNPDLVGDARPVLVIGDLGLGGWGLGVWGLEG
jgi:hypothetical protein